MQIITNWTRFIFSVHSVLKWIIYIILQLSLIKSLFSIKVESLYYVSAVSIFLSHCHALLTPTSVFSHSFCNLSDSFFYYISPVWDWNSSWWNSTWNLLIVNSSMFYGHKYNWWQILAIAVSVYYPRAILMSHISVALLCQGSINKLPVPAAEKWSHFWGVGLRCLLCVESSRRGFDHNTVHI